ncbi:glycosyltransferase [Methylobacterium sp. WL30]|nr:glycosyltransferase [Methylobacterium sp. WL116]TXN27858.1 glycosyltransferase [Methylobacterium sp. WL93]TXN49434.1 glycosyltransferase [Methylobacterium sp. WL119]TXN64324.1 glycosyltransferase [Methylobacterium sp. WL30]
MLPEIGRGGWVVLTYREPPTARPRRPMLRLIRAEGAQDVVLPGVAQPCAHWLGLLPDDLREIRLAAGPGFVLERVGRRTEASLFLQALATRPLRAVSALYERLRGDERRYRDTLRGTCAVTPRARFSDWAADRALLPPSPEGGGGKGAFGMIRVLVLADADAESLAATLASLRAQTHPDWRAIVLHATLQATPDDPRIAHEAWRDDRGLGDVLGIAPLCLLRAGDWLRPDALARLAAEIGTADLIYADELRDGAPRLKPDWSPDLARTTGYQGRPWLAAPALLARLPEDPAGAIAAFPLVLDLWLGARATRVAHLPRILAETTGAAPDAAPRAAALARHRTDAPEPVIRDGVVDLLWPLPEPAPRVSIVIPSRDRLDLIERVCRGVLHETAYPAIECVIVDNGSTDPAVLAHYDALRRDRRVRIVAFDAPFNFSAMVNAGVAAATGAVVVLLNNDVAVLHPDWLDAMVRQALRPEVGAVGAKLLYANGTLQHAGVVVGLGGRAGHILRKRPAGSPGRLGQMRVAHEVSAVTAACLAVSRENYRAVGGFDAEAFPVDFNDVDFCLRLGAAGCKTVWTPAATLAHLESVSRGPSVGAKRIRFEAEAARFTERWRDVIRHDPFYHPALSLTTFGEDLE